MPGCAATGRTATNGTANGLPTSAANVARLYTQLAADLRDGTRSTPDFTTAHALHALIERVA